MVTSKGTLEFVLDALGAPTTVNSFVFLARWHYYDGIVFHRMIPGFVLQGGDPTGTGAGGPGYSSTTNCPSPDATNSARSLWRTPDRTPTARSSSSSPVPTASVFRRSTRSSARS